MMDPIDLAVYWGKLVTITEEGASTIARTAFSRIVTDARDYSCVLCDERGDLIAQPLQSLPEFVGSLQQVVGHALRRFPPEQLAPGDTIMTNDPWLNTSQMNDFSLISPVWRQGRIVAYAASVAHAPDVGGRLLSAEAREVYEEGICLPLCKLWEGGRPHELLFDLIRANVRLPDVVVGDLEAQHSAHHVMASKLLQFMDSEGLERLTDVATEVKDRAEAAARARIEAMPDGRYESCVVMDGVSDDVRICCQVEIAGDSMDIGFEGTSEPLPGSVNCALNYIQAEAAYAALLVCRPGTHINRGSLRPVTVTAPEDCLVNVRRPTAVGARTLVVQYVTAAVLRALSAAVPDRVLAEPGAPVWPILASGIDDGGRVFIETMLLNGGLGAHAEGDGLILGFPAPVVGTKVEALENDAPFVVLANEYRPDSGGAGRMRGGPGQSFDLRSASERGIHVTLRTERLRHPARGTAGGHDGGLGEVWFNWQRLSGKETLRMSAGDVLALRTPGGGGYGPPVERDVRALECDLRDGVVSAEAAAREYGYNPLPGDDRHDP